MRLGTAPDAGPAAGEAAVVALCRAYHFAAVHHVDQRRKGARAEPYLNHLVEVAALLAEATGGTDPELIIAGVLHDAIEDTSATRADIAAAFGEAVARLVEEVSDDKSLPKAERKRRQVLRAPAASPRAKQLILADKIANVESLAASPPAGWSRQLCQEYVAWAAAVAAGCRGVNAWLDARFAAARAAAEAALAHRGAAP